MKHIKRLEEEDFDQEDETLESSFVFSNGTTVPMFYFRIDDTCVVAVTQETALFVMMNLDDADFRQHIRHRSDQFKMLQSPVGKFIPMRMSDIEMGGLN